MKLNKIEKIILNDLFKSTEGLFIYTLYSRYKVSPKILFETIENLKASNYITGTNERIEITKEGIESIVKKNIKHEKKEFDIKEEFLGPQIKINSFYVPRDFNF
ncbi:hypothetical protein CQ046_13845 [Chryseobacterium sp. MYb7]|uniref:hypothetical protein n=1 Tax=Chryseobacterium sp. MYb7 TaxID=1827290 RepID=UPI000CFE39D2|nr:hypothetical protein [Chryseobacterium sp. MYb7]PRB02041.1 hypothetical protein CQ046_13845 [Chryseobacterium sp. MYb7]